jgi:hypothetical protein
LWTATKKNANFDSSETGGRIPNGGSNDNFEFQHQLSIAEAKFLLLHLVRGVFWKKTPIS